MLKLLDKIKVLSLTLIIRLFCLLVFKTDSDISSVGNKHSGSFPFLNWGRIYASSWHRLRYISVFPFFR